MKQNNNNKKGYEYKQKVQRYENSQKVQRQKYQGSQQNQHNIQQQQQSQLTIEFLQQLNLQLCQCLQTNTTLRMKYADQAQRFYPSQQQLNILLQRLSSILSQQQHLPLIIQSKILLTLIKLLQHPNMDLSISIIQIFYQLFEQQPNDDKLFEIYYRFIIMLIDQYGLVDELVSVMVKLDEENSIEEYETGLHVLKLYEIFGNLYDTTYTILGEDKRILEYLANRIMPNFKVLHKIIDDNKYVASDILISILTNSQKSQQTFSSFNGIQILLQTISSYQIKLPQHIDQKQFLNNLFSCLSVLLINYTIKSNKNIYYQMKGNYLMINFVKMKMEWSMFALKVIANSLMCNGDDWKDKQKQAVHDLINNGILKYLFLILKRKGVKALQIDQQKIIDEHSLIILYSMSRSVSQVYHDRVQYKLAENKFQNLQRIFQLRNQYIQFIGKQIEEEITQPSEYITKLSEGLSFIEIIDKIILVINQKYFKLKSKMRSFMEIYGVRVKDIEKVITQHYKYLGNKDEKQYVGHLLAESLIRLKEYCQKSKLQQNSVKKQ